MRVPLMAPLALATIALVSLTAVPAQADPAPVPACAGAPTPVLPGQDPADPANQATLASAVALINEKTDLAFTPVCIHTVSRQVVAGTATEFSLKGTENGSEGLDTLTVLEKPWLDYIRVTLRRGDSAITVESGKPGL